MLTKALRTTVLAFGLAACLAVPARAEDPAVQADPGAAAQNYTEMIASGRIDEGAKAIAGAIGAADRADSLAGPLGGFRNLKAEVTDKVVDKTYGTSLRQIIYVLNYPTTNFLYLRYNFKRTGKGWMLVDFTFKTETREIFPKDFTADE